MALWIGLILLALIGIVDLAGLIIQLTIGPRDIPKKKILVFFIPYLVFFAVVYFHPFLHGNWIEWFLD
jgi:hypothetical protein